MAGLNDYYTGDRTIPEPRPDPRIEQSRKMFGKKWGFGQVIGGSKFDNSFLGTFLKLALWARKQREKKRSEGAGLGSSPYGYTYPFNKESTHGGNNGGFQEGGNYPQIRGLSSYLNY